MSEQPELPLAPEGDAGKAGPAAAGPALPPGDVGDGPLRRLVDVNFLQYASYVIRDRAIPDIDDGLKPVQRRILHSLHANDDGKFIKVANIVGYTMQFHPHGDASIEDALVGLANRRYVIEGQGNFGNVFTGDPAAASRYIECRLTELAREVLFHDELTAFVPTYDSRRQEPVTLPARLPLLLLLGADGIAVGISTRILPHNFGELLDAQIAILNKQPFQVFPDFQQGGRMDVSGYEDGRGSVRVRARIDVTGPESVVIRELPFGATTDSLIATVEEAARQGKLKIRSINDFTAEAVEIEVQLQPGQDPALVVEALYAFSQCEVQVPSRIVVIKDRRPVDMTVSEVLRHNTERLLDILRRQLKLARRRMGDELHRKTLVRLFVEHRVYKTLEDCDSVEAMEEVVLAGLQPHRGELDRDISRADVAMLLDLPVRRLSRFDAQRNLQECAQLREGLLQAERDLAGLVPYAVRYLRNLARKFAAAYPRLTRIETFRTIAARELTRAEFTIQYDRAKGYVGHQVRGEPLVECSSLDKLFLAWSDGRTMTVAPPDKLFVDAHLILCEVRNRNRDMLVVFVLDGLTYVKQFAAGRGITNKEYRCIPKGGKVLLLTEASVPELYVKYAMSGTQTIRQQVFETAGIPGGEARGAGVLMSSKTIAFVGAAKPPRWNDADNGPRGRFLHV